MATNTTNSFTDHTGNNTAGPFSISFGYLAQSEVVVTVGGVTKTLTTHYTFPSATTISFTSGNHPAQDAVIKFQRNTNVGSKKVDFQDGSVLTESDLDKNGNQMLYSLQEFLDDGPITTNDLLDEDNMSSNSAVKAATQQSIKAYVDANTGTTNLSYTAGTRELASSTGTNVNLPEATTSNAGLQSSSDKTKLDGIASSANNYSISSDLLDEDNMASNSATKAASQQSIKAYVDANSGGSGSTNLSATANGTSLTVESSSGDNVNLPAATTSAWGVMSDDDKTKLDGIETSATADQTGAEIKTAYEAQANTNCYIDMDKQKLAGITASANNYSISSDLLDEDNMASDSATKVPSQQSVKAYVDANAGGSDTNTTYGISCVDGDNTDEEKIRLTAGGSGSGTDDVVLEAGTGLSIARSGDKITFTNTVTDTNTQLTTEEVQDIIGAMVAGNTETNISVTYDDTNGKLDFVSTDTNTTYSIQDGQLSQNNFTNTLKTKLDGIEASADVTDATNVNSAGAVMNSDLDGKGELLVGDGSGDPAALAAGTDGYILKADSNEATGVKWAAAGAGGDVNQNAFSNFAVSGQDTVAADSTTDTVTLIGGTNVTITTNASSDEITFTTTDTNTQLTTEEVQDIIGAMVAGNTETNIVVTYDDTNGKLNFVSTDTNTTYSVVTSSANGLAPQLPGSHGGKFLKADGTWEVPPDTNTTYSVQDGQLSENNFTDADHTKLNGIETSATADQTGAEIKTAYEAESDTNAYTDAEKTKLAGIEASATADQTNAEIRTAVEAATDSNVFTDADHTKLNAIEASATADQTGAEIKTAYEAEADTNAFTDTLKTKLDGIATGAEVNVQSDWNSSSGDSQILNKPTIPTNTDTTYSISCVDGDNTDEEKIRLTAGGDGSGTDDVVLEAGTGLSIARSGDKITFTNTVTDTNTQLTEEQVEDFVGGMVTGNTETGITVTYQDADGTLDFAVADQTPEGTAILSTGESGGTKFLREDGDGTCSWQTVSAGGSGDIEGVTAGTGLTGGGTSGTVTVNADVGIADDKLVQIDDADAADDDYAKFTANGIEGRSYAEVKTDLSLSNVENTAVSTWAGSANITTLGTVSTVTSTAVATPGVRKIHAGTSAPGSGLGAVGDIFVKY